MSKPICSAIAFLLLLVFAIPYLIHLAEALLVPAVIVVVLYIAVRVTNARLNRW